jgi:hypothetical protein
VAVQEGWDGGDARGKTLAGRRSSSGCPGAAQREPSAEHAGRSDSRVEGQGAAIRCGTCSCSRRPFHYRERRSGDGRGRAAGEDAGYHFDSVGPRTIEGGNLYGGTNAAGAVCPGVRGVGQITSVPHLKRENGHLRVWRKAATLHLNGRSAWTGRRRDCDRRLLTLRRDYPANSKSEAGEQRQRPYAHEASIQHHRWVCNPLTNLDHSYSILAANIMAG